MNSRVAVIGAGVAGAVCARSLAGAGARVTVFDKGRSVGGRLAQRRREGAVFDHGAQFVRPRDRGLARLLARGVRAGIVARWAAAEVDQRPAYIGKPAMAAPLKTLLADLPVATGCRITALARDGVAADGIAGHGIAGGDPGWWLVDAGDVRRGPFDATVIAVPPVQARELLATLGDSAPAILVSATEKARLAPCWAVLLAFDPPLDLPGFDAEARDAGPIAWIARNNSKPGRDGRDAWTVHAAPGWSEAHLEEPPQAIAAALLAAFRDATGIDDATPCHIEAHRWRYSLVTTPVGTPALFDPEAGLGLCGDWCLGGKVEAAFRSGRALAKMIRDRG